MRDDSAFNRRKRKELVETFPRVEPKFRPIQKDEILGLKPLDQIPGLYRINEKTNTFEPKAVPKRKGNLVVVKGKKCPKQMEQNVICDDVDYFDNLEFKVWVPYYFFYVGQFVTFWTKQAEYIFQIFPNDDPRLGEFQLIEKRAVVRQPGSEFRTAKTKSV